MKKYVPYGVAFLLGVIFAGKARQLPGLNKLPAA